MLVIALLTLTLTLSCFGASQCASSDLRDFRRNVLETYPDKIREEVLAGRTYFYAGGRYVNATTVGRGRMRTHCRR